MTSHAIVEIAIPVYNEESELRIRVSELCRFLETEFPFESSVVIVDNASTDRTAEIANEIAELEERVSVIRLEAKGKGLAVYTAWINSQAEILVYMDLDLSTNLRALHPLVAPLMSRHSDIAIGTRLSRGARVRRGAKREMISRSYNFLVHVSLGTRFTDAHCGFKAIRAEAARRILPLVDDRGWFFDTELLACAERTGLRIFEVPVDWVDHADSRVNVTGVALDDIRGLVRLFREFFGGRIPLTWFSDSLLLPGTTNSFGSVTLRFALAELLLLFSATAVLLFSNRSFHGSGSLILVGLCFLFFEKVLVLRFATGGRYHFLRTSHWMQVLTMGVISLLIIFIFQWLLALGLGSTSSRSTDGGLLVGLFLGGFLRLLVAQTWLSGPRSRPKVARMKE